MHAGVQGEGRRAVGRVARLVFVGGQGGRTGRQGSGGRAGDTAPLTRQDGRRGRGGDQAVGRGRDGGVEGFAGRGRVIEAGKRDIDDGVGFFRGRVMDVMREPGIRGVRRGGTPVTARPARGAGGGPGLVERGFEAGAPGPAARGRHRLRAHGQRLVRLHGVRRRRARPRDRRPGVRRRHGHQGGGWCRGRRNRRHHGPPRMAAWTVSRTVPAMARGASASCTPPGSGNAACLPPGRHGRRPVRQRHGRGRRRRVQDRARPAAQALLGSEGPGIGDVPVGLVAGTRSVRTGPRATGHRNGPNRVLCKPSGASRPTIRAEQKKQAISNHALSPQSYRVTSKTDQTAP